MPDKAVIRITLAIPKTTWSWKRLTVAYARDVFIRVTHGYLQEVIPYLSILNLWACLNLGEVKLGVIGRREATRLPEDTVIFPLDDSIIQFIAKE